MHLLLLHPFVKENTNFTNLIVCFVCDLKICEYRKKKNKKKFLNKKKIYIYIFMVQIKTFIGLSKTKCEIVGLIFHIVYIEIENYTFYWLGFVTIKGLE